MIGTVVRHFFDSSEGIQKSLGFWIPFVSGIPDSLSCIPESKAQDSGFYWQKFPRLWNPYPLHVANVRSLIRHTDFRKSSSSQ